MSQYWKIPRMWKGETAFIIGGGPSVADIDLTPLRDKHVVGVNTAYQLGPDIIDIIFFGDKKWWRWHHKKLADWPNLIVSCTPPDKLKLPDKRVLRVARQNKGWSNSPERIAWNQNTGYAAVNFTACLGVDTIVLLGFDMTSVKKKGEEVFHWHKEHPAPRHLRTSHSDFKRFLKYTSTIALGAKNAGITLLNASPVSQIPEDVISRIDFKEFIENEF